MRRLPDPITATMLRDFHLCEHRFHLDRAGDPAQRDPENRFVQMLWDGGLRHERAILDALPEPVVDLRAVPLAERREETERAVAAFAPLILGARIASGDLLGMPDLLRLDPFLGYVAGDVKSGAGEARTAAGVVPKVSYGVQVAHYAAILSRLGWGPADVAFVVDDSGEEVAYDLKAPLNSTGVTLLSVHAELLARARLVRNGAVATTPAAAAACAQCAWRSHCRAWLEREDDPTLIPQVGRTLREELAPALPTVRAIAGMDLAAHLDARGRSTIPGIGAARLERFRDRARLLSEPGAAAFARSPLDLPHHAHEIHYDVESDPLNGGVVYLHGMAERLHGPDGPEVRYAHFFADRPGDEGEAFAAAWAFLSARPHAHLYVWSRFERTSMRALQRRHPHVCTPEEVEALFAPARTTDLYTDVVLPGTEWPLTGYGLKKVARHVGFDWRDEDPSGANSIAWFAEWIETGDPDVRRRIIRYNEDDVLATVAVLDALRRLPVRP